jgi:hypothetical protein
MWDPSVALCLTPQAFSNINPKADIFNNINQQVGVGWWGVGVGVGGCWGGGAGVGGGVEIWRPREGSQRPPLQTPPPPPAAEKARPCSPA